MKLNAQPSAGVLVQQPSHKLKFLELAALRPTPSSGTYGKAVPAVSSLIV